MADGLTHQKSNRKLILLLVILNTSIILALSIYLQTLLWSIYLSAIGGLIFGYLNGPDLDQPTTTINETEVAVDIYKWLRKRKCPYYIANFIKQSMIISKKIFWYPYSFIPHRHWLSHSHVISTALRELYFMAMWVIIINIFYTLQPLTVILLLRDNIIKVLVFFINNCIVDSNHLRLDGIKIKLL